MGPKSNYECPCKRQKRGYRETKGRAVRMEVGRDTATNQEISGLGDPPGTSRWAQSQFSHRGPGSRPRFWTSDPQNCEEVNSVISPPTCGILLWQPSEMQTA